MTDSNHCFVRCFHTTPVCLQRGIRIIACFLCETAAESWWLISPIRCRLLTGRRNGFGHVISFYGAIRHFSSMVEVTFSNDLSTSMFATFPTVCKDLLHQYAILIS